MSGVDTIGEILWFMMFVTPMITIPVVLRNSKLPVFMRLVIGLLIALLLSLILYHTSLAIIFRDGMGP